MSKSCSVNGCNNKYGWSGLCATHNSRLRRTGTLEYEPKGWINTGGYREIYVDKQRMPVHRHVMSLHLNRPLFSHEQVHHINGDKLDNRIENLELWSVSQPPGQRVDDKLNHYINFLKEYGYTILPPD